jgi:hypothetical protein
MEITNFAARDQLPQPGVLNHILIASAFATSQLKDYDAGYVLDGNENTGWKSKGIGEALTIVLTKVASVKRIYIEWDPDLPRTGSYAIAFANSETKQTGDIQGTMDTSMFSVVETDIQCDTVVIVCNGNVDNDLNGIRTIEVYGNEE